MIRNDSEAYRRAIEVAAQQLVTMDHRDSVSYIKVPLIFPSGSTVVVRVADAHPHFFISDHGAGHEEADMMGAATIYTRYGRSVADRAGISFDHYAFFMMKASRDQLPGAIVTVANCALETVTIAVYKLDERKRQNDADALYKRLLRVFQPRRVGVAKDATVTGRSNTKWHISALVEGAPRKTLFEPVSNHHASIFAASTKFHDIAGVDQPPGRVAVVHKKAELDTYLTVLAQNANVIESGVSDDTIARLAEAA